MPRLVDGRVPLGAAAAVATGHRAPEHVAAVVEPVGLVDAPVLVRQVAEPDDRRPHGRVVPEVQVVVRALAALPHVVHAVGVPLLHRHEVRQLRVAGDVRAGERELDPVGRVCLVHDVELGAHCEGGLRLVIRSFLGNSFVIFSEMWELFG